MSNKESAEGRIMKQRVYNVYRGPGVCTDMTYRVVPGDTQSQYHTASGWQWSLVSEHTLRRNMPIVAKNVRFKHENH